MNKVLVIFNKQIEVDETNGKFGKLYSLKYKDISKLEKYNEIEVDIYPKEFTKRNKQLEELGFKLIKIIWEQPKEKYYFTNKYIYLKEEK